MGIDKDYDKQEVHASNRLSNLIRELDRLISEKSDPRELFFDVTQALERIYEIDKGLLALKEGEQTRFIAAASWSKEKTRKKLSLLLPSTSSFFEKVAKQGQIYTENFAEFYDGNQIEKRLLMGPETQSFMIRPLKHDTQVVGLLGYSSNNPDAFVTFEESLLDPLMDRFATLIANHLLADKTS